MLTAILLCVLSTSLMTSAEPIRKKRQALNPLNPMGNLQFPRGFAGLGLFPRNNWMEGDIVTGVCGPKTPQDMFSLMEYQMAENVMMPVNCYCVPAFECESLTLYSQYSACNGGASTAPPIMPFESVCCCDHNIKKK